MAFFTRTRILLAAITLIAALTTWFVLERPDSNYGAFVKWWRGNSAEKAELVTIGRTPCTGAPFSLPTDGFIGLLYDDPRGPYSLTRRHQGIDIFIDDEPGTIPVYAVYDGYVRREDDWVSTIIQRIPSDPLNPDQQMWVYYTHMADEDGNDFIEPAFDRGTNEQFVEQGTLLGYVGNYDGNQPSRIWPHLHISLVRDGEDGVYLNEYFIDNTYNPSDYFKMDLTYGSAEVGNINCRPAPQ